MGLFSAIKNMIKFRKELKKSIEEAKENETAQQRSGYPFVVTQFVGTGIAAVSGRFRLNFGMQEGVPVKVSHGVTLLNTVQLGNKAAPAHAGQIQRVRTGAEEAFADGQVGLYG